MKIMLNNSGGEAIVFLEGIKYVMGHTYVGNSKIKSKVSYGDTNYILVYETVGEINAMIDRELQIIITLDNNDRLKRKMDKA